MRKAITIFLFLATVVGYSQVHLKDYDRQRFHAGFVFGLNQSKLVFENVEGVTKRDTFVNILDSRPQLGYHIGGSLNFQLLDMIYLRALPNFSLADRIIRYNYKIDSLEVQRTRFFKSKFLSFPIHMRISTPRIGNFRSYFFGGVDISYELTGLANRIENPLILDKFNFKPINQSYDVGVGFDFYLKPFKLSSEARLSNGIGTLLDKDSKLANESVFSLKSQVLYLSVIIH